MATIYHPIQLNSCEKNKKFEKDESISNKFYNLTVNTYKSIRKLLPMFYKKYIRKPMFINKILKLFDKSPENFKDWACPNNCSTAVCYYRNTNPGTRYLCYKLFALVHI